jgi:hypothetical protein
MYLSSAARRPHFSAGGKAILHQLAANHLLEKILPALIVGRHGLFQSLEGRLHNCMTGVTIFEWSVIGIQCSEWLFDPDTEEYSLQ